MGIGAELGPRWAVFLTSMVPVVELRGAIPLGLELGLPVLETYLLALAGTVAPVIPILLVLRAVQPCLLRVPLLGGILSWAMRRTEGRRDLVEKYGAIALVLFVAVPLPTTGAWTASLAAFMFQVRYRSAIPAIVLGSAIAGLAVLAIYGALSGLLGFL